MDIPELLVFCRKMFRLLVLGLLILVAESAPAQKAPSALEWQRLDGCRLVANPYNDGDSFHVEHEGKKYIFRLYFVDSPENENSFPDRVAEQAAYFRITPEASLRLGDEAASIPSFSLI